MEQFRTYTLSDRTAPRGSGRAFASIESRAAIIPQPMSTPTVTCADLEPLATKADIASVCAELGTVRWVVGIQSAITVATFAIVAAKLL